MSELVALVDALAAELGRPVGLDDRRFRSLAYSSHVEEVDRVRRDSILRRAAPPEVTAWLESRGLHDAAGIVRVEANPGLGMAARVCVPVRFDGTLLGYLWLIDEPARLTDGELAAARVCARDLGVALFRTRQTELRDRGRERELLGQLLGEREATASAAAATLLHDGLLAATAVYGVLALQAFGGDGAQAPDAVRAQLAAAAEQVRRGAAPRQVAVLPDGEQVVMVLACTGRAELERRAAALAAAAEAQLAAVRGWAALVGAGEVRDVAAELGGARREAAVALRVGRAVGGFGPVVRWQALGVYRTLAALLPEGAEPPPSEPLRRLLSSPEARTLVPTLVHYLDCGADVRAAAEALYLHRSSLYGRLRRIEDVAGVDLRAGADRLELHLALRLHALSGRARGV